MNDIRVGARLLAKDKGFSLATVLTLALCIGANTGVFSIVHSVLLRPLPVPEAERLVLLYNSYPRAGAERGGSGVPDYYDRLRDATAIETLSLYEIGNRATGEVGRPERVLTMGATPSFFRVAGVKAAIGRTFTDDEGQVGHDDKVVLSHAFWEERYAGDPGVVGRQLRLDGRPCTIVGVMPRDFHFVQDGVRLWLPLAFDEEQKSDAARHNNSWTSIGRLRRGATIAQAQAQVDASNAAGMERIPALKPLLLNTGFHTVIVPLQEDLVREVRGTLYLLWGGTLFVLLIGCVNVINLALVRSRGRLRELATRLALGAGRWQVARQLFIESLLLTLTAGVVGLLLGWGALRLVGGMNLEQLPRASEIRLDSVGVLFTLGLATLLGIAVGAFPLANVLHVNLSSVFHEGGRTGTGGRGPRLVRRALVVTQVAVAFVLLIGAGLLVASFQRVLSVDPGFDSRQVLTASVTLRGARYPGDNEVRNFVSEALRRIRSLPGVSSAGVTSSIPFGFDHSDSVIFAEGYRMQPGESVISPTRIEASAGYFEAMRIPLRRGRYFTEGDNKDGLRVVIVDERLAHRFWPGRDPIGRRMYRPENAAQIDKTDEKTEWFTVVGVVGAVKQEDLAESKTHVGTYYFQMEQVATRDLTFAIRTSGSPLSLSGLVRREVAAVDPELPVFAVKTMGEWTDGSLATRRWPMVLSIAFGVVALLLSAVGIYGVLAYVVTQRTKEIGIRMALGSTPRSIFELVVGEGVWLLVTGILAGAAGAFAIRRSIEAQLFEVRPTDPNVFVFVTLVLASVALAACVLPARRATRVDPVLALNHE